MVLFLSGCGIIDLNHNDPAVARVRMRTLRQSDVNENLGANPGQVAVESYIDNWVEQQLWDIAAKKSIRLDRVAKDQIDKYRSSLRVREYREQYLFNNINVNENDVINYYEQHSSEFITQKEAAFIELFACSSESVAKDVLSELKKDQRPALSPRLMLVYKGSLSGPLNSKIFSNNTSGTMGPIEYMGVYYIVTIIEKYPKNSQLKVEHVRRDIIQKLRLTEYSNVLQKKQKELKDRFNVKIFKNTNN